VAVHCDMATCRSNPTPRRADNAGLHGERATFSQCGSADRGPTRLEEDLSRLSSAHRAERGRCWGTNFRDGPRFTLCGMPRALNSALPWYRRPSYNGGGKG
jgi:hypothetical protein